MTQCPYLELCERDLSGPALSDAEQEGLSAHLSEGCPSCEGRIEEQLSGSGEGEEAEQLRELDDRLTRAVDFAGEAMAGSQLAVLAKVRDRIGEEDRLARRRVRRRSQRILFYVVNLVAVVLLAAAYVGTLMATRVKNVSAQRMAINNELNSIAVALAHYVKDHPGDVPQDLVSLIAALRTERPNGRGPYYPFDADRLRDGVYLDGFSSPYRFKGEGAGGGVLYSLGPNRKDDAGLADDLTRQVIFAHE
jgi:hypothetical protein